MSRNSSVKIPRGQQEDLSQQFAVLTGSSPKEAMSFLKKYNWNINTAVDAWFTVPAHGSLPSAQKLGQVFDKYKDASDRIGIDGTIKLCEDLDVSPEDVVLLAIAHECKCPGVGEFTRDGWIGGLQSLGCESVDALKRLLPSLRQRLLSDPVYFKAVYFSTFGFAKPPDSRVLPLDSALAYQALLVPPALQLGQKGALASERPPGFGMREWAWWEEFLGKSSVKAMTKDVWNNFIDFVRQIDSEFKMHDLEAAWPSVIDEFVEFAKGKVAAMEK
ncbi:defective in Cullin neddylation protein 1 [Dacryopinax primogenitus]|uniref:Defective in cullin neddylation protein n=1 Tax=Dacryopinax primogenitus (strain DJM 731) TaxID=1858805 RepID=M5FV73_DACPD|nr:defective in Cullin neddylation protein 1 [Dacryopinax primogenitus]EJT97191.1 defective in Cullin neddylation protein 1 [Dacryopinax primogenitus]